MTTRDLFLFLAGMVASSINAAAGGGTLLSFPSLIAGGLNPLAANATSTVALLPGQLASFWAYRREIAAARADAVLIAVPGVVGGALGALLLLRLGNAVFEVVVPVLLLAAAVLLVLQPTVSRFVARRTGEKREGGRNLFPALLVSFGVSVYFGYFGAGAGILFMGAMGFVLTSRPLGEINALKVELASLANLIAASVFVALEVRNPSGAVHWRAAFPLALGGIFGGYFGVGFVRKLPPGVLRAIAAFVGIAIGVYLAVRRMT
ncbi:MAG TPA: sulfite exporter TauE/SafE family protein [Myxococcales bacterium]